MCVVLRGRFGRRGAVRAQVGGRTADVHSRRLRTAAEGRGQACGEEVVTSVCRSALRRGSVLRITTVLLRARRQSRAGDGLALRIICAVTAERLEILRQADAVLQEEVRRAGLYGELWQSFAVLPAVRSVGVQGDERTYGYPVVIRAVTSDDAMTADWARLPYDLVETISARIVNEIPGVNRVVLDVTSKPPATIEWE